MKTCYFHDSFVNSCT